MSLDVCRLTQPRKLVNIHLHTMRDKFMAREVAISVRTTPIIRDAVDKAAAAEGRTRAQWVERLLSRELEARGLLPKAADPS
jgi:hypothetical protein